MSTVNIFALGGLQENGKNLYVVEVDKRIFILDAGIKHPTSELYGVDCIEPDLTYLIENSKRINGIFLSHGHDDHIGAVASLLKKVNVPIFGSNFTLAILKDLLQESNLALTDYKFFPVTEKSVLTFGNAKVKFFTTNHSIPESMGISVCTPDGNIIYTGNYNFDQNGGTQYYTSYDKLVSLSKEKVLALLPESLGAIEDIHRESILEFTLRLNQIFNHAKGRIIISLFSSNLQRIQQIIDISLKHNKRIAIIGRKTQRTVNIAMNLGYLNIPKESLVNLRYIDERNQNNDDDLVVLVTGERHEPYYMLQRMCRKIDRLIRIEADDTIIIMTKPFPGTEKMASKTLDLLYKVNDNITIVPTKLLLSSNASREESKTMINILKPKYIFPVIGEYRHLYSLFEVAKVVGYDPEHFVVLDNGDIATLQDGEYIGITGDVLVGDVLIDGKGLSDVNDAVLRDRELLAESGVILVIGNINPRTKKVVSGPEIISKGFMSLDDKHELMNEMKQKFLSITEKYFSPRINWNEYKNELRQELSKIVYKHIKFNPLLIPVVIAVDA